jgi:phage FluMu protein Com
MLHKARCMGQGPFGVCNRVLLQYPSTGSGILVVKCPRCRELQSITLGSPAVIIGVSYG